MLIMNKSGFIRMKIIRNLLAIFVLSLQFIVLADEPVTMDNRIKTYLYNENEIYPLVIYYGYQTSIELAKGEEVSSISMGESYSWQVTPVGRRIFIKPYEENMHTNMTVLTNKRAYHFDLFSKKADSVYDENLVYVMRFYYPDDIERLSSEQESLAVNSNNNDSSNNTK
jgi:type IV secretion system protein VirB9